jgi:ComF family protein
MSCRICAEPMQAGAVIDCARHAMSWKTNAVRAPYLYADPLDRYIYSLKFRNERRIGRALGLLLAEAVQAHRRDIDAVVPVPLHASRLLERGYNQALEIARSLSFELRLPILRAGIYRSVATPPQTRLRADSRRENLRFAFEVHRDLAGYRLAILDDVITTGATVNGLAGKLREAGAAYVEAWAVARTPRSD